VDVMRAVFKVQWGIFESLSVGIELEIFRVIFYGVNSAIAS
jgi:hypothetical protein